MRRTIRLKEWGIRKELIKKPTEEYLSIRPLLKNQEYQINTDAQGFITSSKREETKEESVFFLGDSFVEAMFVEQGSRFTDLIEAELFKTLGIECCNGGYSGATSLHLMHTLLSKVLPFKPKVIFFVVPSNDAFAMGHPYGYWANTRTVSPIIPHEDGIQSINSMNNNNYVRAVLRSIHETCISFSAKLVFCTFPHRRGEFGDEFTKSVFKNKSKYHEIIKRRVAVNEVARRYCKRRNVPLVDLERSLSPYENYSVDDVHLSDLGSELVSKLILEWWRENEESIL